ncbi:AAA family ATPase [Rubinisphaera brasiliensis]|uniref:ATPase associated with various cellular activities AAA_3 n=1 Tax=Rubinisphaera brasiliensis (strain ATCC 49424 / DSM 5305 / JCM 21570 / IAM 15109 / NBRC 103401 / IFAM 1448) TaxID=756272 RepID=F0SHA7_RUBBR|nr:MoxR family ATPase [Rubinisphaera brasiliensis]ADY61662.1 ATPase associated with various cellular activities AAA_3 [Rubinisphaera brasiliensis DSM 5305]
MESSVENQTHASIEQLIDHISQVLLGKEQTVRLAVTALLAQGHLLVEDAPGVGKTSLAKALAMSLNCKFTRLQFTPDLLPSDILGTTVFLPNKGEFEFREGPIFTNILLADEINRTTPRTQSALLEAMSESQVSIDGRTHRLDPPFFVLATQNPHEFEGTYPLPENQLDRFMLRIEIGYPTLDVEKEVLRTHQKGEPVNDIQPVLTTDRLLDLQRQVREVRFDDSIHQYILEIVHATREHEELSLGISTRGAVTMMHAVQAYAFVNGRDYVVPDDVKELAAPVFAHRVVVGGIIRETHRQRATSIISQILSTIAVPV